MFSCDLPKEAAVADATVFLTDLSTGGTSRFNPEESPEETVGPDNSFPWSKEPAGESGDLQCEALGPDFAFGHDSNSPGSLLQASQMKDFDSTDPAVCE